MFNRDLLAVKMASYGDTHHSLASALGMSKTNFSSLWNGRVKWQTKHIVVVAVRYDLTPDDVWKIFFESDADALRRELNRE